MKKVFNILGPMLVILLAFSSCQQAPFLTFSGQKSFTFKDTGGSETITFSCNRAWTVQSSESWLTVSPANGEANEEGARVTITCAANTTYDPRSATVTISSEGMSESISVSQETNHGLIVSPTTLNLTNAEQDIEIEVQKNVQYSVAIDKDCSSWISLGGTKALTKDKVTIHIAANTSYDDREGKITFKRIDGDLSQTVTVKQSQTNGLFITTSEYDLSNESHYLSVEVKANVEFEVTSQSDWIEFVETKALKASTISLSIKANESYDNRTGTVIVKQTNGELTGIITINQHQTDGLFVSPTEFKLDNTEQSVDIVVEQNVAYNVVIPDDAKTWIAVAGSNQTKALSKETVTLNIARNITYDDREASVTIKQVDGALAETIKIKQAYGEGLIIEKTEYNVAWDGGSVEVAVKANVEFEVIPEKEWVHLVQTKALSSSTITLIVDKNNTYETRESSVTLRKKGGALSANIIINQDGQIAVSSIVLSKGVTSLKVGKSEELIAKVLPENATDDKTIYWSSSDEAVATVENGIITAISEGSAVMTAKAGNVVAECIVNVFALPDGALFGKFSIAAEKQVFFSQGNLYWDGSEYKFETNQNQRTWDPSHVSDFFWSKDPRVAYSDNYNTANTAYGITPAEDDVLFTNTTAELANPAFTVNGVTGMYRTLSIEEWRYLLNTRTMTYGKDRYRVYCTYGGITGLVLYPDDYSGDDVGMTVANLPEGVVFLPSSDYWSSSAGSKDGAYTMSFYSWGLPENFESYDRSTSRCYIRLVTDVSTK